MIVCVIVASFLVADFAPDELEMGVRELILKDLETFIRRQLPGKYHHPRRLPHS